MKKLVVLVMAVIMMAGINVAFAADERGTAEEAKALVKKAVAYIKEVGKEKANTEFSNPKGKFVYKDLYIYAGDGLGVVLAHPITPVMVGKNMGELKDADGKYFIRELIEKDTKYRTGTIDYRWSHPKTKKVERKQTYFEVVEKGYVVYCGYYK
jgi:signal transduction histidine kinase